MRRKKYLDFLFFLSGFLLIFDSKPPLFNPVWQLLCKYFAIYRSDQNKSLSSYLECDPTRRLTSPHSTLLNRPFNIHISSLCPALYLIFKRLIFLICGVSLFVIWLLYQSLQTEWNKKAVSVSIQLDQNVFLYIWTDWNTHQYAWTIFINIFNLFFWEF